MIFNMDLIGKWMWRMRVEKEKLWYKVLKYKYGKDDGKIKTKDRNASRWTKDLEKVEISRGGTIIIGSKRMSIK